MAVAVKRTSIRRGGRRHELRARVWIGRLTPGPLCTRLAHMRPPAISLWSHFLTRAARLLCSVDHRRVSRLLRFVWGPQIPATGWYRVFVVYVTRPRALGLAGCPVGRPALRRMRAVKRHCACVSPVQSAVWGRFDRSLAADGVVAQQGDFGSLVCAARYGAMPHMRGQISCCEAP